MNAFGAVSTLVDCHLTPVCTNLKSASLAAHNFITENRNPKINFFHIHNPTDMSWISCVVSRPQDKTILMVRRPLNSVESWLARDDTINFNKIDAQLSRFLKRLYSSHKCKPLYFLRLEDLKNEPESTMRRVAEFLGIGFDPSLMVSTMQKKKWWGDPTSPHFDKN
jgi:hypothetical protein